MRKKLDNMRKKVKLGQKYSKINLYNSSYVYGLPTPKQDNIANLIYNTYGNKADKVRKKKYETFIAEKIKLHKRPKIVIRYINPKVEEMKKKEEERKANILDIPFNNFLKEKKGKPLYKLKMFRNVGSKVAEDIRRFRTFKPLMNKITSKSQEMHENSINKIINEITNDVHQKDNSELLKNDLMNNK